MKIETYIRAVGTQGTLVDATNLPAAVNPPTAALGMSATLYLHFFNGEASEQLTAEDFSAIGAWRLSVDEDYNQSTEPILRYTQGISVDEDGTVIVNIPNVSSQKLITALGVKPSGEYIAELMGYEAGETVPIFVCQFSLNVLNRIDLEGGSESVAIEGNYYTNSQVEALLASEYVFSFSEDGENWHETQTGEDVYFRIKNGSVSGAQWSDAISIPRGADGADGQDGQDGEDGAAATIAVGTVTEGEAVTVTNSGTSTNAIFDFTFPKTIQVISTIPAETTADDNGTVYIYVGADTITYRQGDILLVDNGEMVLINRGCRCSEPEQSSSTPEPEPSSSSSAEPEPSSSSTPEPEPSSSSTPEPEPSSSSSEQPTDPTKGLLRVNVEGAPYITEIWNVDYSLIWHDANTSIELTPGKHTVYFQSRPHHTRPDYIEVNIIAGQTITITGTYNYLPSKLKVSGFADYDNANGEYSIINDGVVLRDARYYSDPYSLYGSGRYLYMMQSDVEGYLWVIAGDEAGNDLKAYAYTDLTKTPDQVSWSKVGGGTITVTEAQG